MSITYYVCEHCGRSFILDYEEDRVLCCPNCGTMSAFSCKNKRERDIAVEAVNMRDFNAMVIMSIKKGTFT